MAREKIKILLIEDELFDVRRIENTVRLFKDRIRISDVVSNGKMAIELLKKDSGKYDVVIMDFQIAGGLIGEELIRRIKAIDATLQIIVVTKMTINLTDYEFANSLLEAGAIWYCTKYPGDIEDYIYQPTDFVLSIFNAYEKGKLEKEKLRSTKKMQKSADDVLQKKQLIGKSSAMEALYRQIDQCADSDSPILIQGASGTGKESIAVNIHYRSERRLENFVPINCASLPDNLVESELFGYEKGAFTGANTNKPGLFEVAHRGTIFLDEITELPLSAQATLLRVLQDGEIDKIGRTQKVNVNVRVIAATNKEIMREVKEKRFREDLFYRLNVFPIFVPPLTQRREDIPLLVEHFISLFSQNMSREKPVLETSAMQLLEQYDWPGNIREVQNVVQRLLFTKEKKVPRENVRAALGMMHNPITESLFFEFNDEQAILPLRQVERAFREKYIRFVGKKAHSDAEAARLLGLAPSNFHRLCKDLGLK